MKLIFRLIKLVLLLITLSPFILLAIMYKGYDLPVADFEVEEQLSFTDIAVRRLDVFLSDPSKETFDFTFDKATANVAIKDLYAANNPSFMSDDESLPYGDRLYAIRLGDFGGFKGANVNFFDDGLEIIAGGQVGWNNIFYKTTLKIKLGLEMDAVETLDGSLETQIKLVVEDVSIGNLPIFWFYDGANWIVQQILGKSINDLIQTSVQGFGNFDLDTRTVIVTSKDLLKLLGDTGNENPMLEAVFAMVDELGLLSSTFNETEGGISIELGKLRSTDAGYQLSHQLQHDNDVQELFTGQLSSLLVSSLVTTDTLTYNMHEMAFNQLLDYYVKDSMNITQDIELGDTKYVIETKPLFARFVGNEVHFNIILTLRKENDTLNVFKTSFILKTTPSINEGDLIFTINGLGIGDNETVSTDTIEKVLVLIGENEMIVGNQIILKDFLNEFAAQGVEVESLTVNGKYLKFELKPTGTNADILAELQGAIQDALNDVLTDPAYEDVLGAYEDFLADPVNTDPAAIVDAINNLDPAVQAELFDQLMGHLDSIPNLGDLIP